LQPSGIESETASRNYSGGDVVMTDHEGRRCPPIAEPAVSEQLAKELDRHRGRWVAVEGDTIIADAPSAQEVVRLANERGAADPIVFRVPFTRTPQHSLSDLVSRRRER
jgi:hypothetical protein